MLAKLTFSPFLFFFLLGLLFSLTDDFEKYGGKGRGKIRGATFAKIQANAGFRIFRQSWPDPLLPPTTLFSLHAGEAKTETQLYTTLISIYYESGGTKVLVTQYTRNT